MVALTIILQGDNAWPDLAQRIVAGQVIHLGNNAPAIQVAALPGGMTNGGTSIMLRIDLPDGRVVLAETSLALFLAAADAFRVRYGA